MSHATRNKTEAKGEWLISLRRALPWVSVSLAVIVIALAAWWAQLQFAEQDEWKVHRIRVNGELRQVQMHEVQGALNVRKGQTVGEMDLSRLTDSVSALPWVKHVTIRRVFPGELVVTLFEREPWLRWNAQSMLDKDGDPFSPANVGAFEHLPRIDVGELQRPLAVQEFLSANETLAPVGLHVEHLWLNGRGALAVKLSNDVMLMFGREEWSSRLKRFVAIYPGLSKSGELPVYVDLRYDTGVAVSWPETVKEKTPKTAGL